MAKKAKRTMYWLKKRNNCDPNDCVTVKEFAKRENIHTNTVYIWLAKGKAIGRKCNGIWWIVYPPCTSTC